MILITRMRYFNIVILFLIPLKNIASFVFFGKFWVLSTLRYYYYFNGIYLLYFMSFTNSFPKLDIHFPGQGRTLYKMFPRLPEPMTEKFMRWYLVVLWKCIPTQKQDIFIFGHDFLFLSTDPEWLLLHCSVKNIKKCNISSLLQKLKIATGLYENNGILSHSLNLPLEISKSILLTS